ncbi:MAG: hypothetical protein V2A73_03405, partial [Pseudomonadota bacterium]
MGLNPTCRPVCRAAEYPTSPSTPAASVLLATARRGGASGRHVYRPPDQAAWLKEKSFFSASIRAAKSCSIAAIRALEHTATSLGFRIVTATHARRPVLVILEKKRRGAGVFLVRMGSTKSESLIEAP